MIDYIIDIISANHSSAIAVSMVTYINCTLKCKLHGWRSVVVIQKISHKLN